MWHWLYELTSAWGLKWTFGCLTAFEERQENESIWAQNCHGCIDAQICDIIQWKDHQNRVVNLLFGHLEQRDIKWCYSCSRRITHIDIICQRQGLDWKDFKDNKEKSIPNSMQNKLVVSIWFLWCWCHITKINGIYNSCISAVRFIREKVTCKQN